MTQTSNRLFDELARLMTDAANVAQGVRREASTAFRSQADRLITDLDLVRSRGFRRGQGDGLARREPRTRGCAERVAALEAELAALSGKAQKPADDAGGRRAGRARKTKAGPAQHQAGDRVSRQSEPRQRKL